ncbi:AzlC family ABC transporter permease [Nocardia pulmonis]|uniref:AzlC family ABC transporter permease n=1 Tax=Nocardia pulmonis TaxID=2951408 RepID=UPI003FD73E72
MRSIWRTLDRSDLTGIAAVCLAVGVIGVSYGASSVTSGLPAWLPILLSVLVLAGGAEFLFIGIVSAGGSMVAAVLVGLVVNARHLPYGLALPDVVGTGWRRLLGTHVMNDESVALALAENDQDRRRARFWLCGLGVLLAWPLGAVLGVVIGAAVPDPSRFGLDAVFPAVLLALAVPALRDRATRRAVIAGAAVAAITTPFLAAGLPVLLALPAALLAFDRKRGEQAGQAEQVKCAGAAEAELAGVEEMELAGARNTKPTAVEMSSRATVGTANGNRTVADNASGSRAVGHTASDSRTVGDTASGGNRAVGDTASSSRTAAGTASGSRTVADIADREEDHCRHR